jgi:murein L,D-transpeptidase YafK
MRNLMGTFVLLLLAAVLAGCGGGGKGTIGPMADATLSCPPPVATYEPRVQLTPEQELVKEALKQNGFKYKGATNTAIVVRKADRRLTFYRGLTPVKTYPVVLGGNPVADKLKQGDMSTPEGVYRVVTKFEHPRWSRFILLDYPNTQNWINFAKAKRTGRIPYDADIGGQVGIHGTDDTLNNINGVDWTLGCVSMFNHHIEEIYPLVNEDTLIIITRK